MKVIFFCSYYPQYLEEFYKKNPSLANKSYAEQLQALKDDHFGHWDAYVDQFILRGIDAQLIIPNCKPLQMQWAKENGFKPGDKDWNLSIPYEQTKQYKPDLFYISSMFEYYNGFLAEIKQHARHIFAWINCEIPSTLKLNGVELLLTSVPYMVDQFRKEGIPSELMHSAFDHRILEKAGNIGRRDIDFSFIGSLTRFHGNRVKMIKELMDHTDLQFYGMGIDLVPDNRNVLERLFSKNKYKARSMGQVWGMDMYRTLGRSRITFNAHIDMSKNFIGNMRMYEATGMGTLLLSDGKNAPWKNFNDDEVAYYDNIEEAIEKVQYYLSHEEERAGMAKKAQERTLREYNYANATEKLLEYFRKHIKN